MRKLAMFSCSFAAATAFYVWLLPREYTLYVISAFLVTALVLHFCSLSVAKRGKLCALGLAVGLLWSWSYECIKLDPLRAYCGEERQITAHISDAAQKTNYGSRVQARMNGGNILLYLDCPPEELSLGDIVTVTAEIVDVSRGSGDSENLYYQSRDISLLGFQRGDITITPAEHLPLLDFPTATVIALREHINSIFPDDTEGFVRALLTGDRSGLSYRVRNEMSIVGISHVVAVSGMHVSLLVGAIMLLCMRRRRLAAIVSFFVMFFFAAMLGFTPSVMRSVIMNSVMLLAPLLHRENDAPTSLSFALMVILAMNPWAIANISLQLSFGALAGILLLTPRMHRWLLRIVHDEALKKRFPRLRRIVRSGTAIISTSLGATALTQPLLAMTFGSVSLIAPMTNLLLLSLIGVIFTCSFVVLLIGLLYAKFGMAGAWLLSVLIRAVLRLVRLLAKVPYAAVYLTNAYMIAWLVLVYVLLGVFFLLKKRKIKPVVLLFCILASFLGACIFSAQEAGNTAITVFDVGQGQCIFLRSGEFTVLIDCGGDRGDANGEEVARKLLMTGHRRIDKLILTHYDTDHVSGTEQLLSRIKIGELLLPEVPDNTDNRDRILAAAHEASVPYRFVAQDATLCFDEGTLHLFAPPNAEVDNASLSALMSVKDYDILITGDLSSTQEHTLLQMHALPDLEVLVAGHHGSKNATSAELLSAATPDVVLISVGKNSYGHPSPKTLSAQKFIARI